jgi:hypothetical protein
MTATLLENIIFLLRYRRAPERATEAFRQWKHNADLLPKMQRQLEVLRDARGKFQAVVYDIQGIHDAGSDMVIRYHIDDGPDDLICFQIKSFNDLSKKDYLQELKAQRDDTFRDARAPRHYFIVLCTDAIAHTDKIRQIAAAFKSAARTEVIEPAYAFTFLHHPKARIDAYVKRSMEADDIVVRMALDSIEIPSPTARALIVFMTVKSVLTGKQAFKVDELRSEPILRASYDELREQHSALIDSINGADAGGVGSSKHEPEMSGAWSRDYPVQRVADFEVQLADDLSLVETDLLEYSSDSGEYSLAMNSLRGLRAVVSDAVARYDYEEPELVSYMYSLAQVHD